MHSLARLSYLFIFVISVLFSLPSYAVDFPVKPLTGYYVDEADMMSPAVSTQVNQILSDLYKDTNVVMYVVTIPSFAAKNAPNISIENYTYGLAEKWGLTAPDDNYSILFVIARDDKFARFQLGKSWKLSYSLKTQEILDQNVIPEFRKGDFGQGILNGVKEINNMVHAAALTNTAPKEVTINKKPVISFSIIVLVLILLGVIISFSNVRKARATRPPKARKRRKSSK